MGNYHNADKIHADEIAQLYNSLDLCNPFRYNSATSVRPCSCDVHMNYLNVLLVLQPEPSVSEDLPHNSAPPDVQEDKVCGENDGKGDCPEPMQSPPPADCVSTTSCACCASSEMSTVEAREMYLISLTRLVVCSFCGVAMPDNMQGMA